jgi:LmbE family N-acetylglucosaminyl deacetylase
VSALRRLAGRGRARVARARLERADRTFTPGLAVDPAAPGVVLSPHPDDAVLSCWSVLAGGAPVRVINVFAGVPAPGQVTRWDRICGAGDSAVHFRARLAEDRAVLESLVGDPVNLPVLEQQYRSAPRISLAALDRPLCQAVSAASAVYAPAAMGGGHVDHRLARGLARALARQGMPVHLYADVPYAVRYGWPHWVTDTPREPHLDVDPYWEPTLAEVPEMGGLRGAQVIRLAPEEGARKLAAMRAYRTQFTSLDRGGLLSDPETHGYEVLWRLHARG